MNATEQAVCLSGPNSSVSEAITPVEAVLDPVLDDDDPEANHLAHVDDIRHGLATGRPVYALCGHVWVRKPPKPDVPRCKACARIAEGEEGRP